MQRFLLVAITIAAVGTASMPSLSAQRAVARAGQSGQAVQGRAPSAAATTVQGNALSATNAPLANTIVRLRDARTGRIVNTELTDQAGLFSFHGIDPGTYVVELLGAGDAVAATSELVSVESGDSMSTIVKLPLKTPGSAGLLRRAVPLALIVTSVAAASGVLATGVTTDDVSPR